MEGRSSEFAVLIALDQKKQTKIRGSALFFPELPVAHCKSGRPCSHRRLGPTLRASGRLGGTPETERRSNRATCDNRSRGRAISPDIPSLQVSHKIHNPLVGTARM